MTLDRRVGWHRLLRIKPEPEAMVEDNDASPLTFAAEQYATVSKYAGAFLQTFTFLSRAAMIHCLLRSHC